MASCNGKEATFSGNVNTDPAYDYSIRFIYGGTAAIYHNAGQFTVNVADQDGTLNKTALVNDAVLTGAALTEDPAKLVMKHVGAVMTVKVNVTNFKEGYTLRKLEYCDVTTNIVFGADKLPSDSKQNDDMYGLWGNPTKTIGNITATLAEPIALTADGLSVNLNVIPFDVTAGTSRDIKLTFTTADGKGATATVTKNYTMSYSVARATYNQNTITLDMDAMTEIAVGTEYDDLSYFNAIFTDEKKDTYEENFLPESNTWIINAESIEAQEDTFLANAVEYAQSLGRDIELYFPNLKTINSMTNLGDVEKSIHFPEATEITIQALQNSKVLEELYLPKIEIIRHTSLSGCTNLKTLELATAKGTTITQVDAPIFSAEHASILPNVTLRIGKSTIDAGMFTINEDGDLVGSGVSGHSNGPYKFKEIIVVDNL